MRKLVTAMLGAVAFVFSGLTIEALAQEKLSGTNQDSRIVLAFKVSDATLKKLLPAGWESNPAASGPTKGANLSLVLVNSLSAQDAEGKPAKPNRGIAVVIPAKKTGSDAAGPMVVGGLFEPHYAPGAYGVFLPAKVTIDRKVHSDPEGKVTVDETWNVQGNEGHSIQARVAYALGTPARGKVEAKVYSGAKPDFFRIYRVEQATDVVRSTETATDRVSAFSLKASGAKLFALNEGSPMLVAVTAIPWYARSVYVIPGL